MEGLKRYRLKIEALSPIHIGSGEKIGKKEYIHLFREQLVIVPDMMKMYSDLQKRGMERQFEQYMLHNQKDSLEQWLRGLGCQKKDYLQWMRYRLDAGDAFIRTNSGREGTPKEIACFVKDPYGLPYVPGSSLKGMIRSALLAWEINRKPSEYANVLGQIRKNAGQGNRNNLLARETAQLEEMAFHTRKWPGIKLSNAVCSNLAGMIVRDSDPIPKESLTLSQKIDYTLERKECPLPILRETLRPGTEIYFDMVLDSSVCPYTMENILEALDSYQKNNYEYFYSRFQRGRSESGTVWLGGGAGFLSKTVLYPAFKEEAYGIADRTFTVTLGKNYSTHRHDKDKRLKLSPHICKCTRYNGQLYDMGMGRIKVLEEW